jgi:flagellar biosynthetic protein FliR
MLISVAQAQIFFMVFTRVMAMVLPVPVLGGQSIPPQVRISLGIILSAILIPWNPLPAGTEALGLFAFAGGIFRELIVGSLAGMAAVLTFGALQMAGELMGIGSGFGSGRVFNPTLGETGSSVDQFFIMVGMLLFVVMDGHHVVIQAIHKSFEVLEVNQPIPFTDPEVLVRMAAQMIAAGVQMSLPVVGALLLADLTLGLLARVAPQVQVYFLGLPVKIGLGMLAVAFSFSVALPMMQQLFRSVGPRMLQLLAR